MFVLCLVCRLVHLSRHASMLIYWCASIPVCHIIHFSTSMLQSVSVRHPPVSMSVYVSVHPTVCLPPVCLYMYLSVCLSIYLFVHLSVYVSVHLTVCLPPVCICICLSVCLSVCLCLLSVYLFICLYMYLSI